MDITPVDTTLMGVILTVGGMVVGSAIWISKQLRETETRCLDVIKTVETDLRSQVDTLKTSYVRREEVKEMEARLTTRADRQDQVLDRIELRVAELAPMAETSRQSHQILLELMARMKGVTPSRRLP